MLHGCEHALEGRTDVDTEDILHQHLVRTLGRQASPSSAGPCLETIVLGLDVIGVIAVLVTPFLGMVHHGVLIEMA